MSKDVNAPVLVVGATGKQGGAVAKALQKMGIPVRALVRDPLAQKVEALSASGATLAVGDLNNPATLQPACQGVRAVFSVLMPDLANLLSDLEVVQARNLVEAAKAAGIPQFVQTSTSGTKEHGSAPGWKEGRWHKSHMGHYWESKAAVEAMVREAGFPHWTILRPAFFMENFVRPSFLFANWTDDHLLTIIKPATRIAMVAVQDIGAAAAAAIANPALFDRVELELAGDVLSMAEIAAVLSGAMGIPLSAPNLTADEAIGQGMLPALVIGQEWTNDMPAPAKPEFAHALGLTTTSFPLWTRQTFGPKT